MFQNAMTIDLTPAPTTTVPAWMVASGDSDNGEVLIESPDGTERWVDYLTPVRVPA